MYTTCIPQKSAFITLDITQEKFRAKEILKVLSTESYCTDSCIRLGTGAYRRYVAFPFPASPHFSQEGTDQRHDLLRGYYSVIDTDRYKDDTPASSAMASSCNI